MHARLTGRSVPLLSFFFMGADDRTFKDSGLRRINATNVRGSTNNGTITKTLRKDGFMWEVSYQILPF